ncbi:hypothetical protein [Providencia huaxiensis]|uniref:hypothetical protein n=1 Tax=Providencia huaxiensis TaxID=2027290 RepID=UPI000C7F43FB|nr:hypothetical protein [Providencia huaxiensis]AXH60523.1 hypothetical protein CYG50_00030 [Providencia huaxiensis]
MTNQILNQSKTIERIMLLLIDFNIVINDVNKVKVEIVNSLDSIQDAFIKVFCFKKEIFFKGVFTLTMFDVIRLSYRLFMLGFTLGQIKLILRIIKSDYSSLIFDF